MDTTRVESRLDDPDNLGHLDHFLEGQVHGSHPQTKLSGCDPDITETVLASGS